MSERSPADVTAAPVDGGGAGDRPGRQCFEVAGLPCLTVTCGRCCNDFGGPDDGVGTAHFTDRAEALSMLASCGWTVGGERALCDTCTRLETCERTGHMWPAEWMTCLCQGRVPEHASGCRRVRWCEVCGAEQQGDRQTASLD